MKPGIRGKFFLLSLGLVAVVFVACGGFLLHNLGRWLAGRAEAELLGVARAGRAAVVAAGGWGAVESVDPLADRLGEATGARITIIAADGTVLGDSALDPAQVAVAQNHGRRPEVVQALTRGEGVSQRRSATVHDALLYAAARFDRPGARGVVRAAMPLARLRDAVGRLRALLLLSAGLGLLVAVVMSAAGAHFVSRTARLLLDDALAVARGEGRRISLDTGDEFAGVAGSFNRLAEQLEGTVSDLTRERNRFEAVLEAMTEAVVALDNERRINLANTAAVRMLRLGRTPVGRILAEVVRTPALQELVGRGQAGETSAAEFDLLGPTRRRVLARATPIRATGGLVLVMHDVTEMRRLETVRRDFVANVSHELRTPISVIRANAETLQDGALANPEHAPVFLAALLRSAERVSNLIADLLELSRIESGAYALDVRGVPLDEAVRRATQSVESMARDKRQVIDTVIDEGLAVRADARALDQVLVNLLDNAVKYTDPGGHIVVAAAVRDGQTRIEVRDDGPGIEARHHERIFERFYRVDPARSRENAGTGLGLSIVKHLVEAMDGDVGVESNASGGSVFWFTLSPGDAVAPGGATTTIARAREA